MRSNATAVDLSIALWKLKAENRQLRFILARVLRRCGGSVRVPRGNTIDWSEEPEEVELHIASQHADHITIRLASARTADA